MTEKEFFRFESPFDITIGKGRIIWADTLEYTSNAGRYARGTVLPAGWVLPGGERTQDRARAEEVAIAIDLETP